MNFCGNSTVARISPAFGTQATASGSKPKEPLRKVARADGWQETLACGQLPKHGAVALACNNNTHQRKERREEKPGVHASLTGQWRSYVGTATRATAGGLLGAPVEEDYYSLSGPRTTPAPSPSWRSLGGRGGGSWRSTTRRARQPGVHASPACTPARRARRPGVHAGPACTPA
eukprot:gene13642-biopygen20056